MQRRVFSLVPGLLLVPWLLAASACGGHAVSDAELTAMAKDARATAERVRGLKLPDDGSFKEAVASRDELATYLDERLNATDAREELLETGRVLEDLGALAPGTDLAAAWMKAVKDQVAGYYDWEKKTLFLADWMPRLMQEPILVHETTHALQDAHFGLARFMTPIKGAEDAQAAIQALIEGDASLAMAEALLPKTSEAGRELSYSMIIAAAQQQVGQIDAPPVVAESLLFPYAGGMQLARMAWKRGGWPAIDRMYDDVPLSTEQVIHPEKYLDTPRDLPERVTLAVPRSLTAAGWKVAYRGPAGELGWRIVLGPGMDAETAHRAAAGWDGDETVLLEQTPGGPTITLVGSVWDDETEAREAEAAFARTKVPPRAVVRVGARVAGVWGEPMDAANALAQELVDTMKAREVATFAALSGPAPAGDLAP